MCLRTLLPLLRYHSSSNVAVDVKRRFQLSKCNVCFRSLEEDLSKEIYRRKCI